MALAFDAAYAGDWNADGGTDVMTKAFTCTGSNLVLFVGVSTYASSLVTTHGTTVPTYNGVAMTKVGSGLTANLEGNWQDAELWYLDAPATGANNIVVTLSADPNNGRLAASSYTGKTSSGIDAHASAQDLTGSTNAPTNNVNIVASDCWLVGYAYSRGTNNNGGTGTTSRARSFDGHNIGDSNGVVGPGNTTLAWTNGSSVTWPGVISASISEAGGGGGVTTRRYSLSTLGVG